MLAAASSQETNGSFLNMGQFGGALTLGGGSVFSMAIGWVL
jgi:hypothetical protein